jgi:SAM-dependent methyltransferase
MASNSPILRKPDIGFLPTPPEVIEAILSLAEFSPNDRFYDLGCGDGRILIAAAQQFGIQGVGIDIDLARVQDCEQQAAAMGVGDRLTFYHQDLYTTDLRPATVVMLYLLPHLNLRLRPQLLGQLRSGSRVMSLDFDMGDWQPDTMLQIPTPDDPATLYRWTMA